MVSFILDFGEKQDGDYRVCLACGSRTMLVSCPKAWRVDQEAFRPGERTDQDESVPDEVEVSAEVTGQWCDSCKKLTSICIHQH